MHMYNRNQATPYLSFENFIKIFDAIFKNELNELILENIDLSTLVPQLQKAFLSLLSEILIGGNLKKLVIGRNVDTQLVLEIQNKNDLREVKQYLSVFYLHENYGQENLALLEYEIRTAFSIEISSWSTYIDELNRLLKGEIRTLRVLNIEFVKDDLYVELIKQAFIKALQSKKLKIIIIVPDASKNLLDILIECTEKLSNVTYYYPSQNFLMENCAITRSVIEENSARDSMQRPSDIYTVPFEVSNQSISVEHMPAPQKLAESLQDIGDDEEVEDRPGGREFKENNQVQSVPSQTFGATETTANSLYNFFPADNKSSGNFYMPSLPRLGSTTYPMLPMPMDTLGKCIRSSEKKKRKLQAEGSLTKQPEVQHWKLDGTKKRRESRKRLSSSSPTMSMNSGQQAASSTTSSLNSGQQAASSTTSSLNSGQQATSFTTSSSNSGQQVASSTTSSISSGQQVFSTFF